MALAEPAEAQPIPHHETFSNLHTILHTVPLKVESYNGAPEVRGLGDQPLGPLEARRDLRVGAGTVNRLHSGCVVVLKVLNESVAGTTG